jgi:putative tricarboxylic transport membrane protein
MSIGRDGIAGLVLFAISLVLLVQSFSLPYLPLVPVGPGFYPRIVLSFLALASMALVVQDWSKQRAVRGTAPTAPPPRRNYWMVGALFAIVGAYVGLLPLLGYRIATMLFVAAAQATLGRPHSANEWAMLVTIAFATVVATYLVFETYLLVLLPRGSWTGW